MNIGLIKLKGNACTLAPERFYPMEVKHLLLSEVLFPTIEGYAVDNSGMYWLICCEHNRYFRVPFAATQEWFMAITSQYPFYPIREKPQIYITGTA